MQCTSCHSDCPDNARFCGECGGRLASSDALTACRSCGFGNRSEAKFCGGCGRDVARDTIPGSAAETAGDRRIVTVLFSDVSGFTQLSETLDPEELRDLMDGWFSRLGDIVAEQGGTIDKFIGDAVMVLFGAPVAHEDDPRRACEAALAIHDALALYNRDVERRIGRSLAIRVGINTGRVYAGTIGAAGNRAYTVMGDAVNVASRLESACPVGSTLVSASTYRHVRGLYEVESLEPLQVKGKTDPLVAFRIIGRRKSLASLTAASLDRPAMIGRRGELEVLRASLDYVVRTRRPAMTVVTADVGIGKSAFLRESVFELARQTQLGRVLTARCLTGSGTGPFSVVAELLRYAAEIPSGQSGRDAAERLEGFLRAAFRPRARGAESGPLVVSGSSEVDDIVRVLSHAIGLADTPLGPPPHLDDPQQLLHDTLEAIRKWLAAIAQRGPVVIRIDNLHRAPAATHALVCHLRAAELPLFIVAAMQVDGPELPEPWRDLDGVSHVTLRPLDRASAIDLAAAMLKRLDPPSQTLAETLATRSSGNPLFIEETIRALLEQGILAVEGARWRLASGGLPDPLPVPDSVGQMVQARVDRLAPVSKRALQWASAAGGRFWPAMLGAIARSDAGHQMGSADIELALAEPLEARLIAEAPGQAPGGGAVYHFAQELIREQVYEATPVRARRQWHALLAAWRRREVTSTEQLEPASLLFIAGHLERADDWAQAGALYRRAGDIARGVFANRDARARYTQALACLGRANAPASERLGLVETLAEVCQVDGDYAACIGACDQALELADDPVVRAGLLVRRGRALSTMRGRADALASFEQAIDLLRGQPSLANEGKRVLARALQNLGWSLASAGDLDAADALYREGVSLCDSIDAPLERAALEDMWGTVARKRGDLDQAISSKRHALELRFESGSRALRATSHINLSAVLLQAGDYAAAREAVELGLRIHEQMGNAEGIGLALINLGLAELELGMTDSAIAHLERSVGIARHSGAWYAVDSCAQLADAVMRGGDIERAALLLQDGVELMGDARPDQRGVFLAMQAQIAGHHGDDERARALYEDAVAALDVGTPSLELGIALYRFGETLRISGLGDRARPRLTRAREQFDAVGNVTWQARAAGALATL